MSINARKKRNAFSLVELIAVLAVLSVVTTLGVRALFSISDHYQSLVVYSTLEHRAASAFDVFRQDFSQLMRPESCAVGLRGGAHLEEEKRYKRVRLEDDRISFPVFYENPLSGRRERQVLDYAIDRSGAQPALVRSVRPLQGEEEPQRLVIAAGAISLRIEYEDQGQWTEQWQSLTLPEAIRVSLVLADTDRPYEQIARSAVFRPVY